MKNKESLKQVIKMLNSGSKYPAMQLVKENPGLAAVMSKMIKPKVNNDIDISNPSSHYNLNQSQIKNITERTQSRIRDNESILQLFPDIELSVQILISSILSPKDMVKTEIIYKAEECKLPSEITMKLNSIVQEHLDGYYNLKEELQDLLRDVMFNTGSYIKLILPESTVDEIINGNTTVSTESLSEIIKGDSIQSMGILGQPGEKPRLGISMERFASTGPNHRQSYTGSLSLNENGKSVVLENSLLDITDNYKLLKFPQIAAAANKAKVRDILNSSKNSISLEDNRITLHGVKDIVYKDPNAPTQNMLVLSKTSKRKSIGRPLVMQIASEAVIPIYLPGSEKNHVGYFIMTDIDGNPVTLQSNLDHMSNLGSNILNQQQNQSMSSMLISKARRNLEDTSQEPTVDQITRLYSSIVENDLMERLRNGIYGGSVEIGNNEEIYKIMLARSLSNTFTRLIYVPVELMGYFAFKYFKNGIGKSYLDDVKILSSLRAITLFSKVMAQTKNSIALTHVNITLDPNDPDPQETIEISQNEIMRLRQNYFPLGLNTPTDIVDWIQRAGVEFSFEGHPRLPQTKFDFETKNMQHILPDSDLEEDLRKQQIMTFGLSPEIVDNSFNAEFATTVVSNNILLSKRIIRLQDKLCIQLTDYAKKIISNDNLIVKDLLEAVVSNKGLIEQSLVDEEKAIYEEEPQVYLRELVDTYIETLALDLPKPDITTIENQSTAYDQYAESLDKALDAFISADSFTSDMVGDINTNIDSIKSIVKNYYLRKWMSENGFMAELNDIVTSDEDGNPTLDLFDLSKNHSEAVIRSSLKLIQELNRVKFAANKDLEAMGVEEGSSVSSDTSSDDSGSDDTGDAAGGDAGGDGGTDFSF